MTTVNSNIRDAVKDVVNVEFLDLDSFRLVIDFTPEESKAVLTCRFNDFVLSLRPAKPAKTRHLDLVADIAVPGEKPKASAAFTIGYNDKTKKPQLGWHDDAPPEDVDLRVAVDVMVACMFAVLRASPFPIPLEQLFPKAVPWLRRVK